LFPLTDLPPIMEVITKIDPLSYGVDGIRYCLTGIAAFSVFTNLIVLIILTAAFLSIGSYLFSRIQI